MLKTSKDNAISFHFDLTAFFFHHFKVSGIFLVTLAQAIILRFPVEYQHTNSLRDLK